jgi:hypothetical protein
VNVVKNVDHNPRPPITGGLTVFLLQCPPQQPPLDAKNSWNPTIKGTQALFQTPEGYILKDIYILSLYPQIAKKGYFLSLFGEGYFGDIISLF